MKKGRKKILFFAILGVIILSVLSFFLINSLRNKGSSNGQQFTEEPVIINLSKYIDGNIRLANNTYTKENISVKDLDIMRTINSQRGILVCSREYPDVNYVGLCTAVSNCTKLWELQTLYFDTQSRPFEVTFSVHECADGIYLEEYRKSENSPSLNKDSVIRFSDESIKSRFNS